MCGSTHEAKPTSVKVPAVVLTVNGGGGGVTNMTDFAWPLCGFAAHDCKPAEICEDSRFLYMHIIKFATQVYISNLSYFKMKL